MKRTKSMYYNPTAESRELSLYAENESVLYPQIMAIVANLAKKADKGIYDAEKATLAFFHLMTEASRRYKKDFGYSFDVTARWTAAQDMRDYYTEEGYINA